jgi:glycosyltransferase involved in cell wall biosynthesis
MAAAAQALVCYSEWERTAFETDLGFAPAHIRVIKLGVARQPGQPAPLLSFPHVLHVGRIEPRKNQLSVVRAVRDRPVVLAGDVFDIEYYRQVRAESGPNVLHMSCVSDAVLRGLYQSARVFAFPTRLEVCGLVNLEAGLAGCRVVTSDVGGIREYCGAFPHYVEPDDVLALQEAVARAWDAPADGFAAFVRDEYSWTNCAREHIELYEAVLRRQRGPARASLHH